MNHLTDIDRENLVGMYVEFLDAGDVEGMHSIYTIAQYDKLLDDMLNEVNIAYSEEIQNEEKYIIDSELYGLDEYYCIQSFNLN